MSWLPRISMGLTIAQLSAAAPLCGVRRSSCTRSSRGEWRTCWASRSGGAGSLVTVSHLAAAPSRRLLLITLRLLPKRDEPVQRHY